MGSELDGLIMYSIAHADVQWRGCGCIKSSNNANKAHHRPMMQTSELYEIDQLT